MEVPIKATFNSSKISLVSCLQMEEEEDLSERGLPRIASIMNRVRDLKNKYRNEDNITDELNCTKISADTTGMCFG